MKIKEKMTFYIINLILLVTKYFYNKSNVINQLKRVIKHLRLKKL